jgi:hypothetical protein
VGKVGESSDEENPYDIGVLGSGSGDDDVDIAWQYRRIEWVWRRDA